MNNEFSEKYELFSKTIHSNKQDYIIKLVKRIIKKNNKKKFFNYFSFFSRENIKVDEYLLEHYNLTLNKINNKEYKEIVKSLQQKIKIDEKTIRYIKNNFELDYLKNLFNNDFNYEDLTLYHLNKLFKYNPDTSFNKLINIKKNYRCSNKIITFSDKYEFGIQKSYSCENNEMYYIKFYDMLMLDYDHITFEKLMSYLSPFKEEYLFKIYKTINGYHVFILSHIIPYNSELSREIFIKLKSDKKYLLYSKYNGYNIRLNSKLNCNEIITNEFICYFGKGNIHENIHELINIFDYYNKNFHSISKENFKNEVLFYQNFINLMNIDIETPEWCKDYEFVNNMKQEIIEEYKEYKQYKENNHFLLKEKLKNLSLAYIKYIQKSQRLLYNHKDYYIAVDLYTNLHYICYKNVLMIDIDTIHFNITYNDLLIKLDELEYSYRIYKSLNGYHVFITNKYFNYYSNETLDLLLKYNCDINYVICVYLRGFCVRINKKKYDDNMYELLYINKKFKENKDIISLIDLHHNTLDNICY